MKKKKPTHLLPSMDSLPCHFGLIDRNHPSPYTALLYMERQLGVILFSIHVTC